MYIKSVIIKIIDFKISCLKNTLNKILNDYRFQEINKKEKPIDEEPGIWSEFASEGLAEELSKDKHQGRIEI